MAALPKIPEKTVLTGRPTSGNKREFPRVRKFSRETPERLKQLEHGFILDGVALSRQTNEETDRSNPSVDIGIPQYNPQKDKHCASYFKQKGLPDTLKKPESANEKERKSSMAGSLFDNYMPTTQAWKYLESRKEIGAGYTRQAFGGHTTVPTDPAKPGYWGEEGYRRNTPLLRKNSSVFDYEDPFDNPQPIHKKRFPRTQSAPVTMQLMRRKSASVYRSNPGGGSVVPLKQHHAAPGGRRIYSAMPTTQTTRTTVPSSVTNQPAIMVAGSD